MAKTEKMNPIKTEVMSVGNDDSANNVDPIILNPTSFCDNGDEYEISTELIGIGGESQVYRAIERNTGRECAAKIDTSGLIYKAAERENRKRVVEFLRAHTDYRKYHIIPLLASGTIQLQDSDGMALPYPIDIFPFCPGGDLEKAGKQFTYAQIKEKVIPALSIALKTIHESNLIHRDIKPANICELDGEIVVSDFGTAVIVEENSDEVVHTELARRTLGYSAPEINSRYAKMASDYFSLGCTLATLYNGKHPYAVFLEKESDYAFYELINEKGIEMPYRVGDEALKFLIDALVRVKLSERVGYNEIMLWQKDSKAFINQYGMDLSSGAISRFGKWKEPFSFEDEKYWNEKDLAAALASKWNEAKRYLYRGQIINFFKWDQTMQNRIDRIVNEAPTAKNDDLGLAYFLHYLLKGGSLYWCGHEYKTLSDVSEHIWDHLNSNSTADSSVVNMLQSGYLSWKRTLDLQSSEIPADTKTTLQSDLDGIRFIEQISKSHPLLAYYYAMYQWSSRIKPEISSADTLFAKITKNLTLFYKMANSLENDDVTLAALADLGFRGQVVEYKNQLGNDTRNNVVVMYKMFEAICTNKAAVRSHYYQYGPDSYLYWLKNNLALYAFNTESAKYLKSQIEAVELGETFPIQDLEDHFRILKDYFYGDFLQCFQGDFLVACLGLTKGNGKHSDITASHADAFFIETFYEQDVPLGFIKHLNSLMSDVSINSAVNTQNFINRASDIVDSQAQNSAPLLIPNQQKSVASTANGVFYDVILISSGNDKRKVIEEIMVITNIDGDEAMSIVDNIPAPIVQGVSNELAELIQERMELLGANVKCSLNSLWNKALDREIYRRIRQLRPVRLQEQNSVATKQINQSPAVETKSTNNPLGDMKLICKECGNVFVFTADEQDFFIKRGFPNERPTRCSLCRNSRKRT